GDRLEPLVHVAVQKGQVVDVAAGTATRSQLQVVEVAGFVQPDPASWDAHLPVDPPSIRPQPTSDLSCDGRPESCGAARCQSDRTAAALTGSGHESPFPRRS